ncbi:hypothetical protein ScPMuIL_012291 [Solemya velum]
MKILLILSLVAYSYARCPPSACAAIDCAVPNCGDGERLDQNAGFCGCCPGCVRQIGVGEHCSRPLLGGSVTEECSPGTHCDMTTQTCKFLLLSKRTVETCAEKKASLMSRFHGNLLGFSPPRCEDDGSYSAYQCQGSSCYCVSSEGETIPGYSTELWHQSGMDCKCARAQFAYQKKGIIGRLFHCATNGNYENKQCTGSVCYCVDSDGNQIGTNTVSIGNFNSMNC